MCRLVARQGDEHRPARLPNGNARIELLAALIVGFELLGLARRKLRRQILVSAAVDLIESVVHRILRVVDVLRLRP